MKKSVLIIVMICVAVILNAQTYKGTVKDSKGDVVPFANVVLFRLPDSIFVAGSVTNDLGEFIIESTKPLNKGYVEISCIGYESKTVTAKANIGIITLNEDVKQLGEVVVKGRRNAIKQDATGFKVNVANYVKTEGKSAFDVLKVLPGVMQDNENLSVMGSTATIFVNGRKLQLSGKAKESYLNSLQGKDVKSVKIITNPGARYDANLTGSIIDIKLDKSKASEGVNGNVKLGMGIRETGLIYTPSISLNYRKNKLNLYGNYGYYQGEYEKDIELLQKLHNTQQYYNSYELFSNPKTQSNSLTFGADYTPLDRHILGVLVKTGNFLSNQESNINTILSSFDMPTLIDSTILSNLYKDNKHKYITANLNHRWKTDTTGGVLNTDLTFSYINNENTYRMISEHFNDGQGNNVLDKTGNRQNIEQNNKIWTMRMYYNKPLNNNYTIETGIQGSFVNRTVLQDYTLRKQGTWLTEQMQKSNTTYEESLLAGYVELDKTWKTWSVSVGLRGEHTYYKGEEKTTSDFTDSYFDIFPSASINHKFKNKSNLSLSYARKITRPSLSSLNPYRFYNGYSVYQIGNPNLKPYYSNSITLKYSLANNSFIRLRHSWYNNEVVQEATRDTITNEIIYTYQNFGKSNFTTLYVYLPIRLFDWWNVRISALGRYTYLESYFMGGNYTKDDFLGQIVLYNQFKILKDLSADLQIQYTSQRNYYETIINPRGTMQASVTKTFWQGKGALSVSVSDPFQWNDFHSTLKYNDLDLKTYEQSVARMLRVSFSYNFGSNNIKRSRRRSTGAETIEKRAN